MLEDMLALPQAVAGMLDAFALMAPGVFCGGRCWPFSNDGLPEKARTTSSRCSRCCRENQNPAREALIDASAAAGSSERLIGRPITR